ncbi:MAG: GrpB family protein [Bacteroidota bacterium]
MTKRKIVVVPYDPEWENWFNHLGEYLKASLGEVALRIDHIGSTAVEGLSAKPIVDVQISVADLQQLEAFRIPLTGLGFVFRENNPDLTKRYFREKPGNRRTHIHVRQAGSYAEQEALLFRDYLRTHPVEASEYGQLKQLLAQEYQDHPHTYVEQKAPTIHAILMKARVWSQEIGWFPGPAFTFAC